MLWKNHNFMFILGIALFLGGLVVYSHAYHGAKFDYTREIVLVLMSCSVTMVVTSLLLRQQTQSEELKDTHSEIFRKKFEVYTNFLRVLMTSFEDSENKQENIRQLEESFYNLILFIESEKTFDAIYRTVLDSVTGDDRASLGQAIFLLRRELGIHDITAAKNRTNLHESGFWDGLGEKMGAFFRKAEKNRN